MKDMPPPDGGCQLVDVKPLNHSGYVTYKFPFWSWMSSKFVGLNMVNSGSTVADTSLELANFYADPKPGFEIFPPKQV